MTHRTILHVDLDAFFASVEQRDKPELRGKPVLVGGASGRGVVAAASYEAREFGVFSAMPMAEALRRCPHAIVVSSNMGNYGEASQAFFDILDDFSPLVEGLSVDEAFVDVTGMERLLGDGVAIATQIRARVSKELQLVASVGIAPTKFVAKIASDIRKPDGLFVVSPGEILSFLHPLPVSRLWGVGKVTQKRLADLGLRYIGDVAAFPRLVLEKKLGSISGAHLHNLAHGIDSRTVETGREMVSIGHEETFARDTGDLVKIGNILLRQADKVARRMRKRELRSRTVVLKIKYADFTLVTRRRTLDDPTSDAQVLANTAKELLAQLPIVAGGGKNQLVRLCGLSVAGLEDRNGPRQLGFAEASRAKGERLGDVLDRIQDRFGDASVSRASHSKPRDE